MKLRWTLSMALMRVRWQGDQTGEAYSSKGRTYVVNARVMIILSLERKLR